MGGMVFQHCTRQAYAKMTLLRVVVHYWYFSFTAQVCVMHTMGGGWLVFRRSSLFFFVLPLRFCSLHFNDVVHCDVCTAKRRARIKGFLPKMIFEKGHGIAGGRGGRERYIAGMMHWFLMVYGEGGTLEQKDGSPRCQN